jgi:3-oxoacyl-[acyl-carrier-protein] synthase II
MPEVAREVWITGIGIVSSLGEGAETHWNAIEAGRIATTDAFAPAVIHPLAPLDFDKQIPKKGDQRQMEAWQRIGTYAAGLALDDAGLKGKIDILSRTDLIVAAGGGERDTQVDSTILTGLPKAEDPARFLNERLMNDLRPTLFLAQLSNLMAGNISIVHGVTGSSRTFMGEEPAGVDALRVSLARIASGQSDVALVGGAYNAERKDIVMLYGFAGIPWQGQPNSVWERGAKGGISFGSLGAFLVLEARAHAQARSTRPLARLVQVLSDATKRAPGTVEATLQRLYEKVAPDVDPAHCAVISGATGVAPATAEERAFLRAHPELPVRATATYLGHGLEPQFPMNVALAACTIGHGRLFASHDASGTEKACEGAIRQVLVTSVGHWRGEGMALVAAVD